MQMGFQTDKALTQILSEDRKVWYPIPNWQDVLKPGPIAGLHRCTLKRRPHYCLLCEASFSFSAANTRRRHRLDRDLEKGDVKKYKNDATLELVDVASC